MKKHYLSVLAALTITTSAFAAPEDYVGAIWATAASFCPTDSLPADGTLLQISQNQALYAVLGNNYGGSYPTNFALPNLNGRTIVGAGKQTPTTSQVNVGDQVGKEQLGLTQSQMPAHTHTATFTTTTSALNAALKVSSATGAAAPASSTYLSGTAAGAGMSPITSKMYTTDTTTLVPVKGLEVNATVGGNVAVGVAGGSQPFDNRQPSLGLTYCITTVGIYPMRP